MNNIQDSSSQSLSFLGIPRPTFFSDPLHALLLLSAAAGITGAIFGALAIVSKRERSFMILLKTSSARLCCIGRSARWRT
jgi:hypothetical protein